ncbi:fibronectin type III domain-containing protein [Chloroflexota bacterium]
MSGRKWLILSLAIVMVLSLVTYTGVTHSFFVDDEKSTEDALGIRWGLFTLNDGFENTGSPAWDDLWDENGTTTWIQSAGKFFSGSYSAAGESPNNGYLTTDEIEASTADGINVSFQYFIKNIEPDDCWLQTYNGTDYQNWYDLSGGNNNSWNQFSQVITDSQYLIAGFRIRFDSSLGSNGDEVYIDDVMITTDTTPPSDPTGLAATGGAEQIDLDWTANSDSDLWGYNIYRGTETGNYTEQLNSYPVPNTYYTDTPLYGGGTYYYAIKAVDYGNNESGYSNEAWDTATDAPPAVPTGLSATGNITNEAVELNWDDNAETDGITYTIYRSPINNSSYSELASLVATSNYTDSNLYGGRTYYYKVSAVDSANPVAYSSANASEVSAVATDLSPSAPASVNATAGNEEILIEWIESIEPDVVGYKVWRGESTGSCTELLDTLGTVNNYTDTPLYGGGQYFYVVTAFDEANPVSYGSANSTEVNATADDIAPATPAGLSATPHPSAEAINLDWDDNVETDGITYTIYRSPVDNSSYSELASLVATSDYTDSNLYGGRTYYYKIKAVDSANPVAYSSANTSEVNAIATDLNPSAPASVSATGGDEEILIEWTESVEPDVVGYKVWRGESTGNCTELRDTLGITDNYTDAPIYSGGTYYYVVTAFDAANPVSYGSANSTEVSAAANDAAPAAPAGLNTAAGNEQITLSWTPNTEDDLWGYYIYSSNTTGEPYDYIDSVTAPTTNYTDTPLYGAVTRYYVVKAVDDGSNESAYSIESSNTTIDIAPQPPQNLTANAGDGLIELDWDDNEETDSIKYNIYRSPVTSDNYTVLESLWSTSDYTDIGLTGGVTYYYKVTAIDGGSNESNYSNEAYDTVVDYPPAQPTGLTAQRGNEKIDLNWDDNVEGDLAGYNIYRSLVSDNYSETPYVSLWASSDYTDTGLTGGVPYYYVVTAVDFGTNESTASNQTSATPWTPVTWTQTSQGDFENGVSNNVSTSLDPGNVILTVGGDAGGANMILFWDGGAAPAGWTLVSDDVGEDFYQRFPRGEATYGSTAGSDTHTHTATFAATSAGSGTISIQSGSNAAATAAHTHTLASGTISNDSSLPVYRNLQVIEYNSGVPATIPAGAIAIFDAAPPAGWTQYSAQDNQFVRGAPTAAGTGGSANHTHTVSITTNVPTGTANLKTGSTIAYATSTHTHSQTAPTSVASNTPPYITVILAKADDDIAVPDNMIAMFDASPTGNWNVVSGSGGPLYQKFLMGSSSYGTTGGVASYSHDNQDVNLTTVTGTASNGFKNAGTDFASGTHTHTVGVTGFNAASSLPPYVNVVFAKAIYSTSGTIASAVLNTGITDSEWAELAWDETLPGSTDITFEVRASNTVFVKTDPSPSWTAVGGTSSVTTGLPDGIYKQWRATLIPDGARTLTPVLEEVRLYYQAD